MSKHFIGTMILAATLVTSFSPGKHNSEVPSLQTARPDKVDLKESLHKIARQRLNLSHLSVTSSVRSSIDEMIDDGVDKYYADPKPGQTAETVTEKLANFINTVIENGTPVSGEKTRVDESSLKKAKNALCPLWPFC